MFLLYVCFNKDEKSIQGVIFIFIFRFVSFLVRLCMGLPFFFFALGFSVQLLVCSFCLVILYIWWEGRGLASDTKVGDDSRTVANMRPNFFLLTSLEMRKVI